ncbi:MAG: hypothetical protein IH623_05970 [Verrucomicrobia bacterium]|nr:hypothetical protein [Verrucomicrobiota bacterium]
MKDAIEIQLMGRGLWTAALLLAALLFGGCGKAAKRADFELPIYFTCDVRGRLEPCGCFTGQFGGLTRLKTVLDDIAEENALRVDVGDAIAGHEDFNRIQYDYMLRAFASMKFDVLNIGHREARLSAAELREIKLTMPVPIVSANLLDKSTGKPLFDACRLIERGGYRIAVIGVLDPRGLERDLGEGLEVENMESALTRAIAEARPGADVVVLLAFADEETLARLADQFYEAQVILGGRVRQPAQELKRQNRSLVYFVTNESRALGILRLKLVDGGTAQPVSSEILLLHDKIPQAAAFRQLAQQYRDEIRRTPLAMDDVANVGDDAIPGVRTAAGYVGSERCVECHQSAAAVWAKSGHAHAFATLVARQADADPNCIGCHTTGFRAATGYRREFAGSKLVNVGCESCHGPGSLHVRQWEGDESVNFTFRPLAAGDCKQCHYGEFSRPFEWDEFWPAIKHGKEPRPVAGSPPIHP